jgi:glutamyl-tRNA synthetase
VSSLFVYFDNNKFAFPNWNNFSSILTHEEIKNILQRYLQIYSIDDSPEIWLKKIKEIGEQIGFASDIKTYKKNKEKYRGHIGEVAQAIRYAITGKTQTPDLFQIMRLLGEEECRKRMTVPKS